MDEIIILPTHEEILKWQREMFQQMLLNIEKIKGENDEDCRYPQR